MIIIDFAHLSFKSLFVALDKEAFSKNKVDFKKYKGMFIHLMFNYLKLVQTEFSKDYGNDIILALEGSSSWRKEFYPKYKANRVLNENIDWENDVFPTIDEIVEIIKETLPYKVIKVKGAEGDDVVATLSEYSKEPVMVISEDKDFIQLLRLPNVVLYKPIKKEFIQNVSESEIKDKLRLHILVGDRVDNIPSIMEETRFNPEFIKFCQDNNIYEDDVLKFKNLEISNTLIDLFMSKNKGKSIYKPARFGEKTAEKYLVNLKENLLNDKLAMNNYKRNMILIDFEYIPKDIKESIIKEYENCKLNSDLEKLLRFFLKYDCQKHADDISAFRDRTDDLPW